MVSTDPAREARASRVCLALAFALTWGWFFVYNGLQRHGLCDEPGHFAAIQHFIDRKPGWPESMPMLPGYHFIVVSLWKLHPPLELLTLARLVTTLLAILGLAVFALSWRRMHGRPAGPATLLFALFPLAQPFSAMAYTDMPAVAFALAAFWAHVTGRRLGAAGLMAAAVYLRQTNLVWAGFIVAWEFFRTDALRRGFLERAGWQILLLAGAAIAVMAAGRLTPGTQHGNQFQPNIATLHVAGASALLLGLPVWLAHAPEAWRRGREIARRRPGLALLAALAGGGVAAALALTFANPHIWNRELYWEGVPFTLLRNWPLVWIEKLPWLRVLSGINLVLMAAAAAMSLARQPRRLELCLAFACGAAPAFANSLVEPRYFIPGAVFILFWLEFDRANWRRLALWWALLSALHAPLVVKHVSLW